jgi:hypothetical protein
MTDDEFDDDDEMSDDEDDDDVDCDDGDGSLEGFGEIVVEEGEEED